MHSAPVTLGATQPMMGARLRGVRMAAVAAVVLAAVVGIVVVRGGESRGPRHTVGTTAEESAGASSGQPTPMRTLFDRAAPARVRYVYVEAHGGSDLNSGSSIASAYATIQHAVDVAVPGDRILVGAGHYAGLSIYGFRGTARRWLVIESIDQEVRPIINVAHSAGVDGIDIQQSSFVGVMGFEIEGVQRSPDTNPSGVAIFRGSDHIDVWGNDIHDFPGGGVNAFYVPSTDFHGQRLPAGGWDLLDVAFNTIHDTSKYSPENTSGISFYGAVATSGATLPGGYGYEAVGNYVYDVICLVDSSSGAGTFPYVTDGNVISVDSLSVPYVAGLRPYEKRGLIEGNLLVDNGGRAVHVFNSVNVDGYFNTAVGNLRSDSPVIHDRVEMDSNVVGGRVRYFGNIIAPTRTPRSTDSSSSYLDNVIAGGRQSVPTGNFDRRRSGRGSFVGESNAMAVSTGEPVTAFTPVMPVEVPDPSGRAVPQVLDVGPLRRGPEIVAGALA